jgi:hypothetical protein
MIRSEAVYTGPNPACDGEVMWDGTSVVRVGFACLDRLVGTVWVPVEPRTVGLTAGSGRSTGYDPHRARLVQWTSNIVYTHTAAAWTSQFVTGDAPSSNELPIEYDATNDEILVGCCDSIASTWVHGPD